MKTIQDVVWDPEGRVPVIVQDAGSSAVLALAYMDRAALAETLSTGQAKYWVPEDGADGAQPGGIAENSLQMITALHLACDGQAILLHVQPAGPICSDGWSSCFHDELTAEAELLQTGDVGFARAPLPEIEIQWSPEAAEGA